VKEYCIENYSEFIGFICGLLSQDHDLEAIYVDSFLKIAYSEGPNISLILEKLEHISNEFNIDFIISVSLNKTDLPEPVKDKIVVAL
jgi:hypothetical protein